MRRLSVSHLEQCTPLVNFLATLLFYSHVSPAVCSFGARSPEKVDTNNLPSQCHCVPQTGLMTLDIPEERSHMLTNDWFIYVPVAEETIALRVLV